MKKRQGKSKGKRQNPKIYGATDYRNVAQLDFILFPIFYVVRHINNTHPENHLCMSHGVHTALVLSARHASLLTFLGCVTGPALAPTDTPDLPCAAASALRVYWSITSALCRRRERSPSTDKSFIKTLSPAINCGSEAGVGCGFCSMCATARSQSPMVRRFTVNEYINGRTLCFACCLCIHLGNHLGFRSVGGLVEDRVLPNGPNSSAAHVRGCCEHKMLLRCGLDVVCER